MPCPRRHTRRGSSSQKLLALSCPRRHERGGPPSAVGAELPLFTVSEEAAAWPGAAPTLLLAAVPSFISSSSSGETRGSEVMGASSGPDLTRSEPQGSSGGNVPSSTVLHHIEGAIVQRRDAMCVSECHAELRLAIRKERRHLRREMVERDRTVSRPGPVPDHFVSVILREE